MSQTKQAKCFISSLLQSRLDGSIGDSLITQLLGFGGIGCFELFEIFFLKLLARIFQTHIKIKTGIINPHIFITQIQQNSKD